MADSIARRFISFEQWLLFIVISLLICLKVVKTSDPTVIFLSNNGARQLSSSSQSNGLSNLPFTIQTFGRDSVERKSDSSSSSSSSSSGGVSGGLYSLASVIRERLGERMQDRSSKKGPRIIVIPASTSGQQVSNQQQMSSHSSQMARSPLQGYPNYVTASGYPAYAAPPPPPPPPYVNSPYITSASSPYAQYAIPYAANVQSPYTMYSIPSSAGSMSPSSSLSSGSRYSTAESAPYASYAHPSGSTSSLLGSIFPSTIGSILKYPYTSLYPYLAQALAHTLYGAAASGNQY